MILGREIGNSGRKLHSITTLSTTDLTWSDLGSNPRLRGPRPSNKPKIYVNNFYTSNSSLTENIASITKK